MALARQLLGESILKHRWWKYVDRYGRFVHLFRFGRLDQQWPGRRRGKMLCTATGTFVRLHWCPRYLPRSENVRQRRIKQMAAVATARYSLDIALISRDEYWRWTRF